VSYIMLSYWGKTSILFSVSLWGRTDGEVASYFLLWFTKVEWLKESPTGNSQMHECFQIIDRP